MTKETSIRFTNKRISDLRYEMGAQGITLVELQKRLDGISYDSLKRLLRFNSKQEPKAWQLFSIEHALAELVEEKQKEKK